MQMHGQIKFMGDLVPCLEQEDMVEKCASVISRADGRAAARIPTLMLALSTGMGHC